MEDTLQHTQLLSVLYYCLMIFGIAGLIVPLFNRLHISPVLGFLICGVIISPHHLQYLEYIIGDYAKALIIDTYTVSLMGELGVLALLFMIGLELSLEKLIELKRYIFGLGLSQIVLTTAVVAMIAYGFGNSAQSSVIIGAGFALSSTAIIMQQLKEYGLNKRSIGKLSFSILLMQDLAIIPILVMIGVFAGGVAEVTKTPLVVILSITVAVVTVIGIYLLGKKMLQPVLNKIIGTNKNEWLVAFSLFVLCLVTIITDAIGLSTALGAFLAGILIAETEFRDKVEEIIYPIKSILLGIFFISIGMMVNIVEVMNAPLLLGLSVVGIFIVKGLTLYPLCRFFGIKHHHAKDMSIILSQPGEFTLMLMSVSLAAGIISPAAGQFFLIVTVLGMVLTPFLFRFISETSQSVPKSID